MGYHFMEQQNDALGRFQRANPTSNQSLFDALLMMGIVIIAALVVLYKLQKPRKKK